MVRTLVAGLCAWLAACGSCSRSEPRPDAGRTPIDAADVLARRRSTWVPEERAAALAAGSELLTRLDCVRCHTVDEVPPAGRSAHCVSCHVFLEGLTPGERHYQTLASRYGESVVQRYQRNIEHYVAVPDLTRIGDRMRIDAIARYLEDPHDLRPSMDETMVRVRIDEDEVATLARYFAAVAERPYPPAPRPGSPRHDPALVAEGQRLFLSRGCTTCHTFGNLPTGRTAAQLRDIGLPARLAPNLRFVRDRMDEDVAVALVLEPNVVHPGTPMPDLGLTDDEARAIVAFLFEGDPRLEPIPAAPSDELPAILDRVVTYEEMKERVLGKVCVHCHMNDHERDFGPGNLGGFGYPPAHLRLRTYESLVSGTGPDETRHPVLGVDGTMPELLDRMLRRRRELARDQIPAFHDHPIPPREPGPPGMPMGLPAMTDEELAILRTWIAQGCVGPSRASGMPGITDGYLVPDGPITPNRGCGLRAPSVDRPAWSTAPPPVFADERARDAGTGR